MNKVINSLNKQIGRKDRPGWIRTQSLEMDVNENKIILQKCEIDQTNLKIDKNTYWCISNTVVINF